MRIDRKRGSYTRALCVLVVVPVYVSRQVGLRFGIIHHDKQIMSCRKERRERERITLSEGGGGGGGEVSSKRRRITW